MNKYSTDNGNVKSKSMNEGKMRIADIAELVTKGTTPTTLGYSFQDVGINFVKIESIDINGNFDNSKFAHISDKCNEVLKRSQLYENDILFSIAGAIGRTAIVTKEILPANTNQALAIIRLKNNTNDLNYIRYQLTSDAVTKQIEKQKQGIAQLNLSLKDISNIELRLPPLQEQKHIATVLDKCTKLIAKNKQMLGKYNTLIKSRFIEIVALLKMLQMLLSE